MARSGAKHHVHKYFRLPIDGLWHCGDKRCTHFMPGNMPPPTWKDSICWGCGRPFELTPDNMRADHPVCDRCPAYDADIPEETLESVEEYTDRRLEEARRNRIAPPLSSGIIPPKVVKPKIDDMHTPLCSIRFGSSCDCGAE